MRKSGNFGCEYALYKVHDAFERIYTELLFGKGIRLDHLNEIYCELNQPLATGGGTIYGLYASLGITRSTLFGKLRSYRPACKNQTACPSVPPE